MMHWAPPWKTATILARTHKWCIVRCRLIANRTHTHTHVTYTTKTHLVISPNITAFSRVLSFCDALIVWSVSLPINHCGVLFVFQSQFPKKKNALIFFRCKMENYRCGSSGPIHRYYYIYSWYAAIIRALIFMAHIRWTMDGLRFYSAAFFFRSSIFRFIYCRALRVKLHSCM